MHVAIIGSGAVASVVAHHLGQSGDRLTLVVRNVDSPNSSMPRDLHRLRALRKSRLATTRQDLAVADAVPTDADEIWITTPGNALGSPEMDLLIRSIPEGCPVVSVAPSDHGSVPLSERIPNSQVTSGAVGFLAFQSPLPGGDPLPPGMAYWILGAGITLERTAHGRAAATRLKSGGLPAVTTRRLGRRLATLSTIMGVTMAALEVDGWSLKDLSAAPSRRLVGRAARQGLAIDGSPHLPDLRRATVERAARVAAWGLRRVPRRAVPFDLEAYLRWHFSKVGDQTRTGLDDMIATARSAGRPADALISLRSALQLLDDTEGPHHGHPQNTR